MRNFVIAVAVLVLAVPLVVGAQEGGRKWAREASH